MKIKELQKTLLKKKVDALVLFYEDSNFFYFVQENVSDSLLLIPAKGSPTLLISPLEKSKTKIKTMTYKNPFEELKKIFSEKKIKTIAINESTVSVRQKKQLSKIAKLKDLEEELLNLRLTKTKEEVKKLQKACLLTEKILQKIVSNFNFKTESEVKQFIKIEAIKHDCELSFEPIVASGKNASTPHYSGNSKIGKGFFVIDLGLRYKGYCADITRTFYVGKPSKKEIKKYEELLRIQELAIKKVKSGVKIKELELFARQKLGNEEKYFSHSLGHGLGIDVHEAPGVNSKSEVKLKEGMVITIELGVYHKTGIRIEDDMLVTKQGCKVLTKFPKKLIIFPKV